MVASKLSVLGNLLIPPNYLKFVHPVIEKSPSRKVSPKLAVAGRLKRLIKYYKMLTKDLEILSYLKSFQTVLKEKAFKCKNQEKQKLVQTEIDCMLGKVIMKFCQHQEGKFLIMGKNNWHQPERFKQVCFITTLQNGRPIFPEVYSAEVNCMPMLDLKDAFFSVRLLQNFEILIRFAW